MNDAREGKATALPLSGVPARTVTDRIEPRANDTNGSRKTQEARLQCGSYEVFRGDMRGEELTMISSSFRLGHSVVNVNNDKCECTKFQREEKTTALFRNVVGVQDDVVFGCGEQIGWATHVGVASAHISMWSNVLDSLRRMMASTSDSRLRDMQ